MIAYNICYSTCLGKLLEEDIEKLKLNYKEDYLMFSENFKKFGVYRISKNLLEMLKHDIPGDILDNHPKVIEFIKENCFISPNKILFTKKKIREGVLPIILKELLLTRIMIKNSAKKYDKKSLIFKILNNQQLGIKLLANVTYGYTSAGFSGRMPSSEVADTIITLAKETLLNAIKTVETNKSWNAKVIYGDTDSMFVLLENRSPEDAISIGKEIAETVTKSNPEPIKLQFEKIYCPMVLLSKKHYAGYKYEDIKQVKNNEKTLESKGIETVRRDTCEAVCKIMEKSLKIIFETKDLTVLKNYLYKTFDKIHTGKAIIKDFIFAKEVRLGTYRGNNLPPSAQIAYEKHLKDNNYLPRYKEREPFLVINNINGSKRLKDCIISPEDFFRNKNIFLNIKYYIEKQILPAISRILEPVNVNVYEWYNKYPRPPGNSYNLYYDSRIHFINSGNNAANILKGNFFNNTNNGNNARYKLVTDNQSKNSKTINDFFNDVNFNSKKLLDKEVNVISNHALTTTPKSVKKIKNYSHQKKEKNNFREFLPYRSRVNELLITQGINGVIDNSNNDDERLREISKIIKSNLIAKKLSFQQNFAFFFLS
jgi:DNA polymerase elongation subunit (family B)